MKKMDGQTNRTMDRCQLDRPMNGLMDIQIILSYSQAKERREGANPDYPSINDIQPATSGYRAVAPNADPYVNTYIIYIIFLFNNSFLTYSIVLAICQYFKPFIHFL